MRFVHHILFPDSSRPMESALDTLLHIFDFANFNVPTRGHVFHVLRHLYLLISATKFTSIHLVLLSEPTAQRLTSCTTGPTFPTIF